MSVFCENCGFKNDKNAVKCVKCFDYLSETNESINKLYQRLNEIDSKYQEEHRLIRLSITELKLKGTSPFYDKIKSIPSVEKPVKIKEVEQKPVILDVKSDIKPIDVKSFQREKKVESVTVPIFKEPKEPSIVEQKLADLLSPLNAGLELLISIYSKYKTEKKLPIFFMTIAGIIAILFGAGF